MNDSNDGTHLEIVEQPTSYGARFRYACENRGGIIFGIKSTDRVKTFPRIRINNLTHRALVMITLVTKDPPYYVHPHSLDCKELNVKMSDGIYWIAVTPDEPEFELKNIGVKCVKKKDIPTALKKREANGVDPLEAGYDHRKNGMNIDLGVVRLAITAFLEDTVTKLYIYKLNPVVTNEVYDKKTKAELVICMLSHQSAPATGGEQIMMFTEKIVKDDILVRFFERDQSGKMTWEALGLFNSSDIHYQKGISIRTPPYHTIDIEKPAPIFVQLVRPTDGVTSEPWEFMMIPDEKFSATKKRKRLALGNSSGLIFENRPLLCKCPGPSPDCPTHGKLAETINMNRDNVYYPEDSIIKSQIRDWNINPLENEYPVRNPGKCDGVDLYTGTHRNNNFCDDTPVMQTMGMQISSSIQQDKYSIMQSNLNNQPLGFNHMRIMGNIIQPEYQCENITKSQGILEPIKTYQLIDIGEETNPNPGNFFQNQYYNKVGIDKVQESLIPSIDNDPELICLSSSLSNTLHLGSFSEAEAADAANKLLDF